MDGENKKNSSLTIRLECKTKENLKQLAKNKGITVSEIVNSLIIEYLEKENFKKDSKDQLEKRNRSMEEKIKKIKEKLKW